MAQPWGVLAFAWNVPAIPVHHLEGHLLAPMLEDNPPEFRCRAAGVRR
ncbi:hypothetical protein ACNKHX_18830 [Shigella flexneri]